MSNLNRKVSLGFKRMEKEKAEKIFDALTPEQFAQHFEEIQEEGSNKVYLRRKAVTVDINLPEWVNNIPEDQQEIVAKILEAHIANFVKGQYVNQFAEVGQHDLKFIDAELSKRAIRTSSFDFETADFDAAVKSFTNYISKAINNTEVGARVGKAAERNFSRSVFAQNIGEVNETNVNKLLARLTQWAQYMLEHEEPTEGVTNVFYLWEEKLNKLLQAETVLAADLL